MHAQLARREWRTHTAGTAGIAKGTVLTSPPAQLCRFNPTVERLVNAHIFRELAAIHALTFSLELSSTLSLAAMRSTRSLAPGLPCGHRLMSKGGPAQHNTTQGRAAQMEMCSAARACTGTADQSTAQGRAAQGENCSAGREGMRRCRKAQHSTRAVCTEGAARKGTAKHSTSWESEAKQAQSSAKQAERWAHRCLGLKMGTSRSLSSKTSSAYMWCTFIWEAYLRPPYANILACPLLQLPVELVKHLTQCAVPQLLQHANVTVRCVYEKQPIRLKIE